MSADTRELHHKANDNMKLPPTTKLEWEVRDEVNANVIPLPPQRHTFDHHASKTLHRHWRLVAFTGTLLMLASFIGIERLVTQAERNIAQIEREIELAVEADFWLRDPAAPEPHIQSIEIQNDLAIVQMAVVNAVVPEGRPIADETVIYRDSAEGWERIETNQAVRGSYRYQETDHIVFQYFQEDQNLVEEVVTAIESFTTDLHQDVGLDLPPAHSKVTVRVAIVAGTPQTAPLDLVDYIAWESNGIVLLSPHFSRPPTICASADELEQTIRANVAHRLILLAVEEYQPQAVWRPLIDGVQLWAYSAHRKFDADLANQMNSLLRQRLANSGPLRLPTLPILPPPLRAPEETPATRWQHSVVAKTVIDYIVSTYGRGSLARLLDGMHHHDSWQSLIPAVFGVSTEEFESGWNADLAAVHAAHRAHNINPLQPQQLWRDMPPSLGCCDLLLGYQNAIQLNSREQGHDLERRGLDSWRQAYATRHETQQG